MLKGLRGDRTGFGCGSDAEGGRKGGRELVSKLGRGLLGGRGLVFAFLSRDQRSPSSCAVNLIRKSNKTGREVELSPAGQSFMERRSIIFVVKW